MIQKKEIMKAFKKNKRILITNTKPKIKPIAKIISIFFLFYIYLSTYFEQIQKRDICL
jgi:hypothetical protein